MKIFLRAGTLARRVSCLLLALALLGQLVMLIAGTARADNQKIGVTIEDSGVNLRMGPGTNHTSLRVVSAGTLVVITGECVDSNGALWYEVEVNGQSGYIRSDLITVMKAIYAAKDGVIQGSDAVCVRCAPGVNKTQMGSVAAGSAVSVVGEAYAADGSIWYRIAFNKAHGFVHSQYISIESAPEVAPTPEVVPTPEVTPVPNTPEQFIARLTEQGFPESYHESLLALHALYPNWVFKAHLTGLDWNESLDAEVVVPKSLVENNIWPSSWKLVSDVAYNWETGEWYHFDGTLSNPWVAASREVTAYYMDPRNFLNSTSIFQFLDQSYDSEVQTLEGVEQIIAGSFMDDEIMDTDGTILNYATAIYEAGVAQKFNPYVLAAMILIEQGSKGSDLCSGTVQGYEGYFNFLNIGAYKDGDLSPVAAGLSYAKGGEMGTGTSYDRPWNTRWKSINGGAMFYAKNYISNGKSTFYLKRFNVVSEPYYEMQYSTSVYGAKIEGDKMAAGYSEELRQAALTFYIPVYENMEETPPERPTGDGSPNMKLSSLSVAGYELTPNFDEDVLEYSMVVPGDVLTVDIQAQTMHAKASVLGLGQYILNTPEITVGIVVTAENGLKRTYKINISKDESTQVLRGWVQIDKDWYYFDAEGVMQTGWIEVDEKYYYLNASGAMQVGWQMLGGSWYYFDSTGIMQVGWKRIENSCYFFEDNGVMQTGWILIDETWYYFDLTGAMQTGWRYLGGQWYYFELNGAAQTGWKNIGGQWYYFNETCAMQTGVIQVDGHKYYLGTTGAMQTGWHLLNEQWYYFGSDGTAQIGWHYIDGLWYHFETDGTMHTGLVLIGGNRYFFGSGGPMRTGWHQIDGQWYYFGANGAAQTGWVKDGRQWYYLDADGIMQTGWLQNQDKIYYLNASGAMLVGEHILDGVQYTFDASGALVR